MEWVKGRAISRRSKNYSWKLPSTGSWTQKKRKQAKMERKETICKFLSGSLPHPNVHHYRFWLFIFCSRLTNSARAGLESWLRNGSRWSGVAFPEARFASERALRGSAAKGSPPPSAPHPERDFIIFSDVKRSLFLFWLDVDYVNQ